MTEVVLPGIVEPEGFLLQSRPVPEPAAGEARVRVEATGVSFAEQGMRRGRYPGQPRFPFVPGYDLVGVVEAVGDGVDPTLVGRRVAALTKTGGWATHAVRPAADLVPVPTGVDPGEAETLVVNGLTALQMLRRAHVRAGGTVLVHCANGGVGSLLVQLAQRDGLRVVGSASPRHHERLRANGVEPVDYADLARLAARVRELAPAGVDAVFDNVGGATLQTSWRLLARGGTLVSYGIASGLTGRRSMLGHFAAHLPRLVWWGVLPNGRSTTFYDVWGGHRLRSAAFRARLHRDLGILFGLLADGSLTATVAGRFPLTGIAAAMRQAESRTVPGKVVVLP